MPIDMKWASFTARRSGSMVVALAMLGPVSGIAAQSPETSEDTNQELEGVVVTATLIRGVAPVGAPVVTLGEEAIRASGLTSATDLLRTLPQVLNLGPNASYNNTAASANNTNQTAASGTNLRGLGTQSTLTLINGHRTAPSGVNGQLFDASSIPVSAIGRIEVVADGASATYGTDAVGGVVNIILRKNFDGAETRASYGGPQDAKTRNFSQAFGKTWSSGNILATYEHAQSDALLAADRPQFFNSDLRSYGVPLVAAAFNSSPGNIRVITGTVVGVPCTGTSPCYFGIPAGQNGSNLTGASLPATPGTAANNYAGVNIRNLWGGATIQPSQKRDTVMFTGDQNVNDWLRIFGEAFYTRREFEFIGAAPTTNLTIPNTNPYSPCNLSKANRPSYCGPNPTSTITVPYYYGNELGPNPNTGYSRNTTATFGADAKVGAGWNAEFAYTYSQNFDTRLSDNGLNTNNANPDSPTSANFTNNFNPFIGDGSVTASNQALIAKIIGYQRSQVTYDLNDATLRFDGPVFELPAGKVRLAVGTEYRKDEILRNTVSTNGSAALNISSPVTVRVGAQRHVTSLYAELFVPLLDNGRQKVNLSLAGRSEKYSDFGSTSNPKAGLSFKVLDGLTLNASYGTSFRAPALTELQPTLGPPSNFGALLTTPGSSVTGTALVIGGGDPALGPESATTWSTGFKWKPLDVAGLDLSANYFHISYKDRIGTPGNANNQVLVDPALSSLVITRGTVTQADYNQWLNYFAVNGITLQTNGACSPLPSCLVGIINARNANAGRLETSGVDLGAHFNWTTALGSWAVGADYTRTLHWRVGLTADAALAERLDLNNDAYPISHRGRLQFGWRNSAWQLTSFVNYVGKYTNNTLGVPEQVASYTTTDLSGSYSFNATSGVLKGLRIGLNVRNVFEKDPPFVKFLGQTYTTFDPQNASALGRQITVQLGKQW